MPLAARATEPFASLPLDPFTLRREVVADGASATVASLDAAGRLDAVLAHVATGNPGWLALAPLLAPGTDGSAALGIRVALARALPRNPTGVLRAAETEAGDHRIALSLVCSPPFVEASPAFLIRYRRQALTALARVRDKALAARRHRCAAALKS